MRKTNRVCSLVGPVVTLRFSRRLGWVAAALPHPHHLIGIDDFVHGDDSQSQAFGLAHEHAVEWIGVMFWEVLKEAAVIDGRSQERHADAFQLVRKSLVPVWIDLEIESLAGEFDRDFLKARGRVIERELAVDGLGRRFDKRLLP